MVTLTITYAGDEANATEFAQKLIANIGQKPIVKGKKYSFTFDKQEQIDYVKKLLPQVLDKFTFDETKSSRE